MKSKKLIGIIFIATAIMVNSFAYSVRAYKTKKGIVKVDTVLNVRKTPSTSSKIITTLKTNKKVTIINEKDKWYKISIDDKSYGYVSKDFISIENNEETSNTKEEDKVKEDDKVEEDNKEREELEKEGDKFIVSDTKNWTIVFNKPVELNGDCLKEIKVKDNNENDVPVRAQVKENKIQVSPSLNPYKYGETYTLNIGDNIKSIHGEKLNKGKSIKFKIKSQVECWGLGKNAAKSVDNGKKYEWYFSKYNTGKYSNVNSSVACATMALKWLDPNFNKGVEHARSVYPNNGKEWDMDIFEEYLNKFKGKTRKILLPSNDKDKSIKDELDKGNILLCNIWCDDLSYNDKEEERVGDFHLKKGKEFLENYIIVKGYRVVDNKTYFEVYDPNCTDYQRYLDGSLKGKDRYYSSDQLIEALNSKYFYVIDKIQ